MTRPVASSIPHRLPALTALLVSVPLALTACASAPDPEDAASPPLFGHIHELSFAAGDLFIATHHGVYSLKLPDGVPSMVGDVAFDAMGMATTDDGIYVSGHPGDQADDVFVAPNIGLAHHTEEGGWESIALAGRTDFHALASSPADPNLFVGLPSDQPILMVSTDGGRTWSDAARLDARDVIIDSEDPKTLLATTAAGVQVSRDQGASFSPLADAPLLVVAAPDPGQPGGFVGVDTAGAIWLGTMDNPSAAQQIGQASGEVAAVTRDADTGTIALADERGIVTSSDHGGTWTVVLRAQ